MYASDHNIINSNHMIGIVLRLHEMIYFLPVVCASESDYDDHHNLRKTTPAMLRMYDTKTQKYLGKCLFSNMFPIPYKALIPLQINDFKVEEKAIAEKKLEYLRTQMDRVVKAAKRLYQQKIKNYHQGYLQVTVDFSKLEKLAVIWENEHYGKHFNRFPDSQYFLTNPNLEGISTYYLMNKNQMIAKLNYDNEHQKIVEILEINQPQYAPLECFDHGILTVRAMNEWFRGRGIPSWRDGLDDFLDHMGIKNKDVLLNIAFGLSLSDQYWMNPVNTMMEWSDINFFQHNFNSADYEMAIFEDKMLDTNTIDLYSPNNTSDGMLKKTWIAGEDGKRYMLKGSYKESGIEPFNEVLASMICEILGLEHAEYSLTVLHGKVLSKCECFIDEHTELLSAYSILRYHGFNQASSDCNAYETYKDILMSHGIQQAEIDLAKMFILDYIIANADRHLGNFGVIRNVETLKWERIAPNFDSGQALMSQKEVFEMNFHYVTGSFFYEKNVDFDVILKKALQNITIQLDYDQFIQVADDWRDLLIGYQYVSGISTERIDVIVNGLKYRICKLKNKLQ